MCIDWKGIVKLLLRILIVLTLLAPIAFFFAIDLKFVLIFVVVLLGLWQTKDRLLPMLKRAKVIVGVVFGTFVFLGLILWWALGNPDIFLGFVAMGIFVIILVFGLNDKLVK